MAVRTFPCIGCVCSETHRPLVVDLSGVKERGKLTSRNSWKVSTALGAILTPFPPFSCGIIIPGASRHSLLAFSRSLSLPSAGTHPAAQIIVFIMPGGRGQADDWAPEDDARVHRHSKTNWALGEMDPPEDTTRSNQLTALRMVGWSSGPTVSGCQYVLNAPLREATCSVRGVAGRGC
jgi:hypothetical protein